MAPVLALVPSGSCNTQTELTYPSCQAQLKPKGIAVEEMGTRARGPVARPNARATCAAAPNCPRPRRVAVRLARRGAEAAARRGTSYVYRRPVPSQRATRGVAAWDATAVGAQAGGGSVALALARPSKTFGTHPCAGAWLHVLSLRLSLSASRSFGRAVAGAAGNRRFGLLMSREP